MHNRIIILVVFIVLMAGKANSQTSFAIFPAEKRGNIKPETVEEVQVWLNQVLVESKKYLLVDRRRASQILKEQAFELSGATDPNTIVKLGKIFNVEKFIQTVLYQKSGNQLALQCSVIDVTTGQTELVKEVTMQNKTPEFLGRYCAGEIIAAYPLLGKIEGTARDELLVNLGEKQGLKNGDRLFVARKKVVTSDDGKALFSELVRAGTLEVTSASDSWSRTKVTQLADGVASIVKDDIVSSDSIPKREPKISSSPLLNGIKRGELILEDDMKKHQYLSVMRNDGNSYRGGKLSIVSPLKSSGSAFCFYPSPFDKLRNFIVEGKVELSPVEGGNNCFKLYFRADGWNSRQFKGYTFMFDSDGRYALCIDGNERNNYIIPFTATPLLNRKSSENKFKIVVYDTKFDIYINDQYLVSFEDELYTRGSIGLMARQGTSATVSTITVWKAEK